MQCQKCGRHAKIYHVAFRQNIGCLVAHFKQTYQGLFCRLCAYRTFWAVFCVNALLGWWGILSFFATFAFLFSNLFQVLRLREVPTNPALEERNLEPLPTLPGMEDPAPAIELRRAYSNDRFAAFALDLLFLALVLAADMLFAMAVGKKPASELPLFPSQGHFWFWKPVAFGVLYGSPFLALQALLLASRGQTLGKWLFGIKIVKADDGTQAGFVRTVLLREALGRVLLSNIPLYYLVDGCFLFRKDSRCLHDFIGGTRVVQAPSPDQRGGERSLLVS